MPLILEGNVENSNSEDEENQHRLNVYTGDKLGNIVHNLPLSSGHHGKTMLLLIKLFLRNLAVNLYLTNTAL